MLPLCTPTLITSPAALIFGIDYGFGGVIWTCVTWERNEENQTFEMGHAVCFYWPSSWILLLCLCLRLAAMNMNKTHTHKK